MNKRRKRGNNKSSKHNKLGLVRRMFRWFRGTKRKIRRAILEYKESKKYKEEAKRVPENRPSELQIELNRWKRTELGLLGLILPYDGDAFINTSNLVLEYFDSYSEYSDARWDAALKLYDFKPIMESMRTKLVLETWNICKQIGQDYFL